MRENYFWPTHGALTAAVWLGSKTLIVVLKLVIWFWLGSAVTATLLWLEL
jgi:hypothetical protein